MPFWLQWMGECPLCSHPHSIKRTRKYNKSLWLGDWLEVSHHLTQLRRWGSDTGPNCGLAKTGTGQEQLLIRHSHQCAMIVHLSHGNIWELPPLSIAMLPSAHCLWRSPALQKQSQSCNTTRAVTLLLQKRLFSSTLPLAHR